MKTRGASKQGNPCRLGLRRGALLFAATSLVLLGCDDGEYGSATDAGTRDGGSARPVERVTALWMTGQNQAFTVPVLGPNDQSPSDAGPWWLKLSACLWGQDSSCVNAAELTWSGQQDGGDVQGPIAVDLLCARYGDFTFARGNGAEVPVGTRNISVTLVGRPSDGGSSCYSVALRTTLGPLE